MCVYVCVYVHTRARYSWFDVYFISRHFEFYEMRRSTAFFNNLLDIRHGIFYDNRIASIFLFSFEGVLVIKNTYFRDRDNVLYTRYFFS